MCGWFIRKALQGDNSCRLFCILVTQRKTLNGSSQLWWFCSYREPKVRLIPQRSDLSSGCSPWTCRCGAFTQQLPCKIPVWAFQSKFHNSIYGSSHTIRDLTLTTEFKQFNTTRADFLLSYAILPVIQYPLLYFKVKTDDPDRSYKPSREHPVQEAPAPPSHPAPF